MLPGDVAKQMNIPANFPPWNMAVNTYQTGQQVPVVEGCFAFMFTNVGDDKAFVNNMVVFPSATPTTVLGDSRSVGGQMLSIYKGNILVRFASVGVAPNVEIVQLFFLNPADYR